MDQAEDPVDWEDEPASDVPQFSKRKTGKMMKKKGKASASGSTPMATPALPEIPLATRETLFQTALLASAGGTPFEDVKFFAFSRRRKGGIIDQPLPLLANSACIRKASSHFSYLRTQGFSESSVTDMDAPYPSTRPDSTKDYDYGSDSDLEVEEVEAPLTKDEESEDRVAAPATTKESSHIEEERSGNLTGPTVHHLTASTFRGKPGRVVFLDDIAYKTWKAFIYYAYLGENALSFTPLKSEPKNVTSESGAASKAPGLCSPKSMYRLADKYDIAPLKKLAAEEIKKRLSAHNILQEVFSMFTSLYPEIRALEVKFLQNHIVSNGQGIRDQLPTWLEAMEEARLPKGASQIISLLISKLCTDVTVPKRWQCRYGFFDDMPCLKVGRTTSIGSDDTPSRLVHTGEGSETATPAEDFVSVSASDEDDHVVEDDRRSTRTSAPASTSRPNEQQQVNARRTYLRFDETPAIIMTDTAFQTWRTFVFYAYTHRITFAPLRSQKAVSTSERDTITGRAAQLPSCSPKSMYRLAVKYGDAELQQLARDDLASKLSTQNVLTELFSNFTSRLVLSLLAATRHMELDFLLAHLKHPDITDCLPSWIRRFARGELKDCADTFERLIGKLADAASTGSAGKGVASLSI
ncbi:hypothetical protein VTO73DRAFT_6135 [Trametes versicolor]